MAVRPFKAQKGVLWTAKNEEGVKRSMTQLPQTIDVILYRGNVELQRTDATRDLR